MRNKQANYKNTEQALRLRSLRLRSGQAGQAMLLTVMLLSMSMLGGTALVSILMINQIKYTTDIVSSAQALFAADAGIECVLYKANKDVDQECGTREAPVMLTNGSSYYIVNYELGSKHAQAVGRSRNVARSFRTPL